MAEFRASIEQLQAMVDDLGRITGALTDAMGDADQAVARLHQVWTGEGARAHQAAHQRWSADATEMAQSLGRMRAVLAGARENYDAAVAANTAMWA